MKNELEKLGILIVESDGGEIGAQLFDCRKTSEQEINTAFENLSGKNLSRVTVVMLTYDGGVVENSIRCKTYPCTDAKADAPDGFVLGVGPVKFSEEAK